MHLLKGPAVCVAVWLVNLFSLVAFCNKLPGFSGSSEATGDLVDILGKLQGACTASSVEF